MNDTPLPGSAVLHAVFKEFQELFKSAFPGQRDFSECLRGLVQDDRGLSVAQVSRWLGDERLKKDVRITAILNEPASAKAVAAKCNLPTEIFAAETIARVKEIVERHLADGSAPRTPNAGCWVVTREPAPSRQPSLCETEQRLVSRLSAETLRVRTNLLITEAPFDCGISFLWHLTAAGTLVPAYAEAVYFLRPTIHPTEDAREPVQDFDAAMSWLAMKLHLAHTASGGSIFTKLIESRAVAILLSVSGALGGRAEAMAQTALKIPKKPKIPTAVIISSVLKDRRRKSRLSNANELSIKEEEVNTDLPERYPFFREQWQHYCDLRHAYKPDEGGSRLKRARWHYAFLRERPVYPINIRLRAFFASDLSNFSYFDSTAGFRRLCNMPQAELPIEMTMFRDDVAGHVSIWDAGRREPPLRPLKWCSTAIYWLTEESAAHLGDGYTFKDLPNAKEREIVLPEELSKKKGSPVPEVKPDNFHRAARALPAIIIYPPDPNSPNVFHYVAGIGIKAIVQDHWMRTDPLARSYAHYRIARRLYESRHVREALSKEFPFAPHWGRSGLFFLSECIRHLMRACAPILKAKPPHDLLKRGDKFPDPPTRSMMGVDPFEVLSFCFGQVYWRELDGNSTEMNGRKLSQRHGLYHLSAELLQLMSENEELGKPHWALDPRLHGRYYACAAFAQLELGDLRNALMLFERRYDHVKATEPGTVTELMAALDVAGAKIELHELGGLADEIKNIEARLAKFEPKKDASGSVEQVGLHCRILKGQIAYARDDFENAERLLKDIPYENVGDDKLSIEASHYLVATLGAKAELPSHQKEAAELMDHALQIASRQLWQYASEGEQHVALGFRISMAHLFRNMGKLSIAETWMDSVYIDILRYGCSERTYLSFLREAGRIVRATGRPARAYAFYLKPAAIRAVSRGHMRAARVAFEEARRALEDVKAAIDKAGAEWGRLLTGELREAKEFSEEADTDAHDFVPADPLFSFDLLWGIGWEERLSSKEAVTAEHAEFSAEFERLQREGGRDAMGHSQNSTT